VAGYDWTFMSKRAHAVNTILLREEVANETIQRYNPKEICTCRLESLMFKLLYYVVILFRNSIAIYYSHASLAIMLILPLVSISPHSASLLHFQHNAQMLLDCNSHIMLSIIDTSLYTCWGWSKTVQRFSTNSCYRAGKHMNSL